MIHDKSHGPGVAILGRKGQDSKAADHFALGDIILSLDWGIISLGRENLIVVAMIGLWVVLISI